MTFRKRLDRKSSLFSFLGPRLTAVPAALPVTALVVLGYVSTFQATITTDLVTHVYLAYAFVWDGTASLDHYLQIGAFPHLVHAGHAYSAYLPGTALLYAPVALALGVVGLSPDSWLVLGWSSRIFASVLVAGSAAAVYASLRELLDQRVSRYLTFAYAFGTAAFSVASQELWEHAPTLFLVAVALLLLVRGARTPGKGAAAGLALGLAVLVRPQSAFLAVAVLLFFAHRHPGRLPAFLLWSAGPALFLGLYDLVLFGSPFQLPRLVPTATFGDIREGLVGQIVSPSRGLLIYSPFLIFALLALGKSLVGRRDDRAWLLRYGSVAFVATWLLFSSYTSWWGGHSFGNRYLTDLLPLYMLAIADAWARGEFRSQGVRLVFAAMVGWSVLLHAVGAGLWYAGWRDYQWDSTPDIDLTTWRLWDWTGAQWQALLAQAVTEPPAELFFEAALLLLYVGGLTVLAQRPVAQADAPNLRYQLLPH